MDLKFMEVEATAAERAAVDDLLGPPESGWNGAQRTARDGRVAFGGFHLAAARREYLLPALHAVQSQIGWISRGGLDYVCKRLGIPPAEAYGVATFYALLSTEERPPRVAHVCDDVCCRPHGAMEVIAALEAEFGPAGTVVDGATWYPSPCLGQCDRAPAVFMQLAGEDDVVLTRASGETVVSMLRGDPVSAGSVDAAVEGDFLLGRMGNIDPTRLASHIDNGGYKALQSALDMGSTQVVAEVRVSNLRGRGGAAFPAAIKWDAVANADEKIRYLICNADESEPGTFKDRVLMEGDPFLLVESMTIAGYAIGAQKAYLYIRGEYPEATRLLQSAIDQARSGGYLGDDILGSGFNFEIEVRRGGGAYICGEETALMNSIEGLRGEPRNKPPFPTQEGLFGKPTVINNVETLMNVPAIVTRGGAEFAGIGTEQSSGTKLYCLSGAVAKPGVYEIEMGTTLGELIERAGGPVGDLRAVLLGGAAGAFVGTDMLDLSLTFEDSRARDVSLGSGVVMLFNETADFPDLLRRVAAFFRDESCGQCVPCRVGTVRQEELLSRHISSGRALDRALLGEIEEVMKDASICGLGHTAAIAIRSAIDIGLLETV
ncbi:MAG: NADH-quinone oxidoreductase subunit E [Acidimicrobiia bacterium]|nr:NADH-quinone oxidoreductase subunit E [Acidimicrobiia bacterium]